MQYSIYPMETRPDPRGKALHSFDGYRADFVAECRSGAMAGGAIALADLDLLLDLTRDLAADVRSWADLAGRLELAASGRLAPRRAADIVLETVFEEVLTPSAWRVLASALELEMGER